MDTSTLRWILIIAGVALLAGMFLFGNPERKARRRARPRKRPAAARRNKAAKRQAEPAGEAGRREPTLEAGAAGLADDADGPSLGAGVEQGELPMDAASSTATKPDKPPRSAPAGPPPDKVLALYLQARDNRKIAGAELLEVALKSGMVFGDMDIFHRLPPGGQQPIFSLANLTKPGYFDKNAWNTMETKGVTLFMTLPGPVAALDAWDAMLAASRRLAELLHMDLLDADREVFTRQREGEIREELRAYQRSQLPEG
jgi:cell division protein ZipA